MLTKRLTKFLLKRLFGKYIVCDLDLDQLDVELRSGLIHLKDIDLAIDAINDILGSLPFRIKSGFARSVTVQVPYAHIWASNFRCRLELNYLEIAFTPNDRRLSPDNPSSKLVSSLLSDLDKSKLECESDSESEDDNFTDGSDMALEGVEELTKLFQKLFLKVSAAITSCVLLFDFYSQERGKDVRLVLTIQSLEYGNLEGSVGDTQEKTVRIKDYRVELLEREHVVNDDAREDIEEEEVFTEKSVIIKGGSGSGEAVDYVKLQLSAQQGLTGMTCEFHQITGTLTPKQLTPLLEAAAVFSRSSPPPNNAPAPTTSSSSSSFSADTEQRLASSLPDSFRASSFEKDLKVGSFEKSLSPHDLKAIHEMLSQKHSKSTSSLSKLEAHEIEMGPPSNNNNNSEKDKTASFLSEEDFTETLSEGSDDELFFECNDDIPGAMASLKDKKPSSEFNAVILVHSGNLSITDNNSLCKITWNDMKISHSKGETSITLASFQGEEGRVGEENSNSPLFYIDMIEEDPPTDLAAFGFAITQTKREVNVELNLQPLNINLDQQRIARISSLSSSFLSCMKETSATVTSWKPNISKPPTPVQPSPSPSPTPSPPIPHHHPTRPVHMPPSSFPHNIPGRTPISTSPHSVSPRSFPQALVPAQTHSQSLNSFRAPLSNSFPRNKVQHNPPMAHNLLSYTNSPPNNNNSNNNNEYPNFVASLDNHSPPYYFRNNVPHSITIPIGAQPIGGFLPSSQHHSGSPVGRNASYHHDANEEQGVKRQLTFMCPTIFVNIMLTGQYEGSKVRLSVSNAKMQSCTFSNDEPSTPIKWFLNIHTLDAWLHSPDNSMHPLFEAQLHNTDSEGSLLPIEITLRPRPLEVNYAWPSSFDDEDTELHDLFRHKAMESAQTVVQVVLPHTRIDLSKENYEAALSIMDVFSDPNNKGTEAEDAVKDRIDHGHVTRTTQLALVVFITHGVWAFRETPTPTSTHSHELDFNGFKLVHVSQNVNYSVGRNIPLGGYDIITRSAVFTSIVVDNLTLQSVENAVESIAFSRTLGNKTRSIFRAGLSDDNNIKTINLAFRGITINYSIGSDWLFRLIDFFTPTPSPSAEIEPVPSPLKESSEKEHTPGTQLHVDFDEVSVLYIPPHPLTSRLVLFVEDLRLHIIEFSPLSLNLRSDHCKVLLWDGVNAPKSKSAWHEGYVTVAHHNGLELYISKQPSSVVDIVFNELFVDLCQDSLHVLLELVSNYLGLDIPLTGVADLIVSEDGQDIELSEMLADALSEASHSNIYDEEPKLYPSMDELKQNFSNNNTHTTTTSSTQGTGNDRRKLIIEDDDEDDFDDVNMTPINLATSTSVYNINNNNNNNNNNYNRNNYNNNNNNNNNYNNNNNNNNNYDSDEEGMFLEVNTNMDEETTKSQIKSGINDAMTTSMVGSLVIDDYDPDVAREVKDDNVIYVEVVPSAPSAPPRRGSKETESTLPILKWLGGEEKITVVENYIDTLPPPSDTVYSLPRDYPPSVSRTALRAISAILRLHAGSHWPNMPSADPFLEVKLMDLIVVQDTFAPVGHQASRLVVHLIDVEVTDHVPTSVWHLFLCYDVDVPRMRGSPILLLELDSVRPDPQSILEEYRAKITILPLRFNIDQDAVQFIIKFLSKKDKEKKESEFEGDQDTPRETKTKRSGSMTTTPAKAQEMMFFQSFEIKPLRIKVDYKPKRVDYRSLQQGQVGELLNLFHLEGAVFHLTRIKANGLAGLPGVAKTISEEWIHHIANTQVYNYVAGVRGIRSLVHVGEGVADLVLLPLEGYKDGKIIQGLKKGSSSFLKVLALETLHLGSQVAAGTQGILESAQSMMFTGTSAKLPPSAVATKTVSRLAAQPEDTREGIAHALKSVKRELRTAARTIIAVPIEEYSRAGPQGAMRSVIRAVPVAILRPVIGLTEGISKVALGVRNDIASDSLKTDLKNKYKQ